MKCIICLNVCHSTNANRTITFEFSIIAPFDFLPQRIRLPSTILIQHLRTRWHFIQYCKIHPFSMNALINLWRKKLKKCSFALLQSNVHTHSITMFFICEHLIWIEWNGLVYILKLLFPSFMPLFEFCQFTKRIVVHQMCVVLCMININAVRIVQTQCHHWFVNSVNAMQRRDAFLPFSKLGIFLESDLATSYTNNTEKCYASRNVIY